MRAETSLTPDGPDVVAVGAAVTLDAVGDTEKPALARAGRDPCGDDGPDGPVTFMRCDSSTCPTIVGTTSLFG